MDILSLIIFLCFCGITVAIIIVLVRSFCIFTSIKQWKKAQGSIVKASVGVMQSEYGPCPYDIATYTYSVNGKPFNNDKIRLTLFSGPSLEYPIKNFQTGQSVDVFYNPNKPSESVLELPKKKESFAPALIIIGFVALIGVLLVAKYGYSG
ncbi:MAG: DUF3592 domain-containing protein [Candidatus Peribacteraceae bacterium]|nr:DUF3592 domain-containing protein [Candidatus Peribacteraceae bacterium]